MTKQTLNGFKQFILRGNVVDLAVAVVVGGAFNSVVSALVKDFLTPLIGLFGSSSQLDNQKFYLGKLIFNYGDFLNALITFLILAMVVYFLVVLPINKLVDLTKRTDKPTQPNTKKCPYCLSEIPIEATKCAHCTANLPKNKAKK